MMNAPKAYGQGMADGEMGPEPESGLGAGVQQDSDYDATEEGFTCLGKMPVTGGFFTREPKHGQP